MGISRRTSLTVILIGVASALSLSPARVSAHIVHHDDDARTLNVGETVSRSLNSAGKHLYKLRSGVGKCIRIDAEQKGIDLMLSLKKEDGTVLKSVDRPSGSFGRETMTYVAASDGVLTLELSANLPDALDGGYEITFISDNGPTAEDLTRSRAEELISRGEELRSQAPRESKLKAIELFTEALRLWESLGDPYEQSVALYGIGFTNYSLSNHNAASIAYYMSLKLAKESGWLFGQAVIYSAQGAVQYALGAYDLAVFNYRQAIGIHERLKYPRGLGIAYHGLGTAQMLLEMYSEALETLNTSKLWRERANDNSGRILTGLTLVNLYLLKKQPSFADAELKNVSGLLGPQRSESNGEYLYYLGRVEVDLGRNEAALNDLGKASAIFERSGNRLRLAQTSFEVSRALYASDRLDESLEKISQATSTVEELRHAIPNLKSRIGFSSFLEPFFEQHVRVLMGLHKKKPDADYDKTAFEVAERARSRGLLDALQRRALIRRGLIDPKLLEEEANVRDRITSFLSDPAGPRAEDEIDAFQEVLLKFADIESRVDPGLMSPDSNAMPTLRSSEVGPLLDSDSVLLSYFSADDRLFLWLVTDKSIESFDLGESSVAESTASSFFKCISEKPSTASGDPCRDRSSALGKILLGPIAERINGRKLIVLRHGDLERIPWAGLRNPKTGTYLVETNEMVSLPSASILGMLRKTAPVTAEGVAIFADPVYSGADVRIKGKVESPGAPPIALPRLFASRFEAAGISSLFPSGKVTAFMDFGASREGFLNLNIKDFRILHFATHAVVDDVNPERSAIVLSFFGDRGDSRDGFLRFNDIQRMDINADLVALSACQTGVGRAVAGEGFTSLAQAFFSAGARKVMFTGWQVDDKVTAETMSRFYRKYISGNLSPSAALRATQLSIMRDTRWSHPYYWAAFTLEGGL